MEWQWLRRVRWFMMGNKNFKGEIFPEFYKNNAVFINNLLKKTEEIYNVIGNNDLQLVKLKDLYKPTTKGFGI